jgi:hypothetical protein
MDLLQIIRKTVVDVKLVSLDLEDVERQFDAIYRALHKHAGPLRELSYEDRVACVVVIQSARHLDGAWLVPSTHSTAANLALTALGATLQHGCSSQLGLYGSPQRTSNTETDHRCLLMCPKMQYKSRSNDRASECRARRRLSF